MNALRNLWTRWKRFGQRVNDQVARVILVVFYFTVALPFGTLVRLAMDPLELRPRPNRGWSKREAKLGDLEAARRLF